MIQTIRGGLVRLIAVDTTPVHVHQQSSRDVGHACEEPTGYARESVRGHFFIVPRNESELRRLWDLAAFFIFFNVGQKTQVLTKGSDAADEEVCCLEAEKSSG